MKKVIFIFILSLTVFSVKPQGSLTDASIWLKANTGTVPSTGTGSLTFWSSLGSTFGITIIGTPTFNEIGYNYNPKIHLNGNDNYLEHTEVTLGSVYAVLQLEDLTRQYTHLSTWRDVSIAPHANGNLHGGSDGVSGAYQFNYGTEFTQNNVWKTNGLLVGYSNPYSGIHQLVSAVATGGDQVVYGDRLLGGQRGGLSTQNIPERDWLGDVSEIILTPGNSTIAERRNIESYLAIKYGITLDNSGGGTQGDYTSAISGIVWDASNLPSYHNNVIGIARENAINFYQKQSHTVDDTTRVFVGDLVTTNVANTGTIPNDGYLVVGNNQGKMCATTASNAEMPNLCSVTPLYSRIEREWKVNRSFMSSDFGMDFKMNSCAVLGSINPAHLRLLVDNDGDFSNGGTNCLYNGDGSGISITYSGLEITIKNLSPSIIPNNQTCYITIASIDVATPLPVELEKFGANCIDDDIELTWSTLSESNNDFFTIEKSRDGAIFEKVAVINGAGTSTSTLTYSWMDYSSHNGDNYYRVSQTDFDGKAVVLRNISLNCEKLNDVSIHPNPFNNEFEVNSFVEGTITLIDNVGKIVLEAPIHSGKNTIDAGQLSAGSYVVYVRLKNGGTKFLKLYKL